MSNLLAATDSLRHFLDSGCFIFDPELYIDEEYFKREYSEFCKRNTLKEIEWLIDKYGRPFADKNVFYVKEIVKGSHVIAKAANHQEAKPMRRKYHGDRGTSNRKYLQGLDFGSEVQMDAALRPKYAAYFVNSGGDDAPQFMAPVAPPAAAATFVSADDLEQKELTRSAAEIQKHLDEVQQRTWRDTDLAFMTSRYRMNVKQDRGVFKLAKPFKTVVNFFWPDWCAFRDSMRDQNCLVASEMDEIDSMYNILNDLIRDYNHQLQLR